MAQITLNSTGVASNGSLVLQSNGTTTAVTIDTAQNVGASVTPSAWRSNYKAVQIGNAAAVAGRTDSNTNYFSNNWYVNSSNQDIYQNTGFATLYSQGTGTHAWYTAASGTAGNTISFTQAMTLDASGNWILGGTTARTRITLQVGEANAPALGTASGGAFFGNSNVTYGTLFGTSGAGYGWIQQQRVDGSATAYDLCLQPSGGNLLVGNTSGTYKLTVVVGAGQNLSVASFDGVNFGSYFFTGQSTQAANAADAVCKMTKNSTTNRSLNAGGTVNASGADYAEYMVKSGEFAVAKGDVVGINAQGKLTNVFADAVSFMVKSTDPSYVGGDTWGNEEALGLVQPKQPTQRQATEEAEAETDEEFTIRQSQYQSDKATFDAALEAARQTVDRIAFSGQVPVNVTGATAGQYIIPVNDNGVIKGEAVNEADMTLTQYMKAVGKVIAIESDGRAKIIVKVA